MPLTNYALDNFVAPRLSELTLCTADPLPEPCNFLGAFILSSILQVKYPNDVRAILFNFIRRVEQAYYEYENGLVNLRAHVEEPRHDHIALYFRALAHFEQCLAMLYQAAMFWAQTTQSKKVFEKGDGSFFARVNTIYNVSHHMDKRITDAELPLDATTHVWILNNGIACNDAIVTFTEVRQELVKMREGVRQIVHDLPGQIAEQQNKIK